MDRAKTFGTELVNSGRESFYNLRIMERYKARLEGSLWNKGLAGLVFGGIILAGLLIWVAAIRWFLVISVAIGLIMAVVIHWWNERRPIKTEPKGEIRLHLMDDDE